MLDLKIKNLHIKILVIVFISFLFVGQYVLAVDNGINSAVNGLDQTATKGYGSLEKVNKSLPEAIGKVIGVGLSLIGVVFLGLMIYGGFNWMIARGDASEVTKAKDLIQAAIIGLIIVLGAYAITQFVGQQLLGAK